MQNELIRVERHAGWASLTMQRPDKLNALSVNLMQNLVEKAENLANELDINCLVIRGEGSSFSAGYDLANKIDDSSVKKQWVDNKWMQNVFTRLADLPVVTIAEMQGYSVGAGLLLAAVCDMRYALPDAICYVPELDMGIPYSLGAVATLARYLGIPQTANLVINCEQMRCDDVRLAVFITEVVRDGRLTERVAEVAGRIGSRPNSLVLASVTTLREAGRNLLPPPASDLFTMLLVDREEEAKGVRDAYTKRFIKR